MPVRTTRRWSPTGAGLAQLLKRVPGGAVGLDRSPALLTAEEVLVEAPLLFRGEPNGEEATKRSSGHVTVYVLLDQGRYALVFFHRSQIRADYPPGFCA